MAQATSIDSITKQKPSVQKNPMKEGQLSSIELTERVFICNDFFPIKGRVQISSFLEAFRNVNDQDSTTKISRKRYGDDLVKKFRKFERFDFKHRKALLDLEFLYFTRREISFQNFCSLKQLIDD